MRAIPSRAARRQPAEASAVLERTRLCLKTASQDPPTPLISEIREGTNPMTWVFKQSLNF